MLVGLADDRAGRAETRRINPERNRL